MIVLTPMPSGVVVPPLDLPYFRIFESVPAFSPLREVNINAARHALQDHFRRRYANKHDFVLLMDSDVWVSPDAIQCLLDSWKDGTTPCINTKGIEGGHIITSCALVHRDDYLKVNYMQEPGICQCKKLPNPFYIPSILGKEIKYA